MYIDNCIKTSAGVSERTHIYVYTNLYIEVKANHRQCVILPVVLSYSRTCLGRPLVWATTRLGRPHSLAQIVSNNKVPGVSDHLLNATSDRVIWSNRR